MKFAVLVCIVAHLALANSKAAVEFEFPKPCHRHDPNLKSCFLRQVQEALPQSLQYGLPQYGVRSLDPLEIPALILDIALDNQTEAKGVINDLRMVGFSKYIITDLSADGENLIIEVELENPRLSVSFDSRIAGKVFDIPANFDGHIKGDFIDVTTRFKLNMKFVDRNGVRYISLKKLKLKNTMSDGHVELLSRDPQAQPLLDFLANYVNKNFNEALKLANPYYVELAENYLSTEVEKALSSIPAENLLLE